MKSLKGEGKSSFNHRAVSEARKMAAFTGLSYEVEILEIESPA